MEKFIFDHVIEINNMKLLYNILELSYTNEAVGNHCTQYLEDKDKDKYYKLTINDIYIKSLSNFKWSKNISSWFTQNNIQLINELYKEDFKFLKENGFDYLI